MAEHDILAIREGDGALLLDVDGTAARVFDERKQTLYPPQFRESILARGYWQDYHGPQDGPQRIKRATTA